MDGHRFDALTKAVARGTSRRGIVRGALGAAVAALVAGRRGPSATAQTTGLGLGAECGSDDQCSQTGGGVLCADNGYAEDGALNCCRPLGGACADAIYSADCCGGFYCRGGVCTDLAASGSLPLGSYCTASGQCAQDDGELTVICANNGTADDGGLNCCRTGGGACGNDLGCCAGLVCADGACVGVDGDAPTATPTPPATGGSVALGAACTASAQCAASDAGSVICASNNIDEDGDLNCCLEDGGTCGTNPGLCCGNRECTDGTCQPPA